MSDHLVELLSNLVVLVTVVLGVWKNSRDTNKAVVQGEKNEAKIQDLHNTVNGVLATDKANTLVASELRLKESTAAARAEGVIEGRAAEHP
jgi:hypothetical protein